MLIKSIFQRLLVESKLDFLANDVNRSTIRRLVDLMDKINELPRRKEGNFVTRTGSFVIRVENEKVAVAPRTFNVNIQTKVFHTKEKNAAIVEASWDWATKELDVFLNIQSVTGKIETLHLSMVRSRLYNVIRHELEHSSQGSDLAASSIESGHEMSQDKANLEKKKRYYTDASEVPAFVAGIRNQSKKEHRSFYDVMEDDLDRIRKSIFRIGTIDEKTTESVVDSIRKVWIDYAKDRYPGLK